MIWVCDKVIYFALVAHRRGNFLTPASFRMEEPLVGAGPQHGANQEKTPFAPILLAASAQREVC
jgi:hypothetical protein